MALGCVCGVFIPHGPRKPAAIAMPVVGWNGSVCVCFTPGRKLRTIAHKYREVCHGSKHEMPTGTRCHAGRWWVRKVEDELETTHAGEP